MLLWEMIILICGMLLMLSIVFYSIKYGITPTPTSPAIKKQLLEILNQLRQSYDASTVAELGAGWGTLAFPIAKRFPEMTVYAYEGSLIPYWFMKMRLLIFPQSNLIIQKYNFYQLPMDQHDCYICYLFPGAMAKLASKFRTELRLNSYIISHTFVLPTWQPKYIWQCKDLYRTNIYLYDRSSIADAPTVAVHPSQKRG